MTARDSSDSVCYRHNGQAESKSYSQRSDTCTNRPAALPAKTALPHPIRTRTIVPIISAKYFFMIVFIKH